MLLGQDDFPIIYGGFEFVALVELVSAENLVESVDLALADDDPPGRAKGDVFGILSSRRLRVKLGFDKTVSRCFDVEVLNERNRNVVILAYGFGADFAGGRFVLFDEAVK